MGGSPSQGQRRERARGPGRDFVRVCELQGPLANEVWSRLTVTFDLLCHLRQSICLAREHLLRSLAIIAARARDH
jgi:hypothetical protein